MSTVATAREVSPLSADHQPSARHRAQRLGWPARLLLLTVAAALCACAYIALTRRNSPRRAFERGLAALRAKNPERVAYELARIERLNAYEPQVCLLQSWLDLEAHRPEAALEKLEFAIDPPETRPLAWALTGRALYAQGRFREAIALYGQALEEDPNEAEAHRWLGVAYYDIGTMALAIPHLERAAALAPTDARSHRLMGLIRKDFREFENAIEDYQESFRRDPHQRDDEQIRFEQAQCEFVILRFDDALETLRACRDTPDVLGLRAECYLAKGEPDPARQCVAQALAQDPNHVPALVTSASMATADGDRKGAAELLARAVELAPKDYNLRYRLVRAYKILGRNDLADEHSAIMDQLLALLEEMNELNKRALDDPNDPDLRYQIGMVAEKMDMPKLAETWYKAALALDPGHLRAKQALLAVRRAVESRAFDANEAPPASP